MKNVVCIYSGGMDSFTLVNDCQEQGRLHSCLSFNYGQRHWKELIYATRYATKLGVPHQVINLEALKPYLLGSSLTTDLPVPEGHYAEESMKLTVVPNRNMIMLSIAIAYAVSHQLQEVWFGAHSGDHAIYPDCREEFVTAMDQVAKIANWHSVHVAAPYQHLTKVGILEIGYNLRLDYAESWTCYQGENKACGKCGSCGERLEAFAAMGKVDPLEYAS